MDMPRSLAQQNMPIALMLYPGFDGWHWQIRTPVPGDKAASWPSMLLAHSGTAGLVLEKAIMSLDGAFSRIQESAQGIGDFEVCLDEPHPPWRSDYVVAVGTKPGGWYFMVVANVVEGHDQDGVPDIVPKIAADGGPFASLEDAFRVGADVLDFCRSRHDGSSDPAGLN